MRFKMDDVEGTILREIADRRMTRDDVAMTYAFALRQHDLGDPKFDYAKVNRAIMERWSRSALRYIKVKAGRLLEGD